MAIKRQLKTPSRSLLEGVLFSSTLILFPILIRILPNFGKKIQKSGATLLVGPERILSDVTLEAGANLSIGYTRVTQGYSGYIQTTETLVGWMPPECSISEIADISGYIGGTTWHSSFQNTPYGCVTQIKVKSDVLLECQFQNYNSQDGNYTKGTIVEFSKDSAGNIYAKVPKNGARYFGGNHLGEDLWTASGTQSIAVAPNQGGYGVQNISFSVPISVGCGTVRLGSGKTFATQGDGNAEIHVTENCVFDLSGADFSVGAKILKTGAGVILFGEQLPNKLVVNSGILALQLDVPYDMSNVTLEKSAEIMGYSEGKLLNVRSVPVDGGKIKYQKSEGVFNYTGTEEIPEDGFSVLNVSGEKTFELDSSVPVDTLTEVVVDSGATLKILSSVDIKKLVLNGNASLIVGENGNLKLRSFEVTAQDDLQKASMKVLSGGLMIIFGDGELPFIELNGSAALEIASNVDLKEWSFAESLSEDGKLIALPSLIISEGAAVTVPGGAKFGGVDLRISGILSANGDLTLGYSASGETCSFDLTVDGGVVQANSGVLKFLCPDGTITVPDNTITFKSAVFESGVSGVFLKPQFCDTLPIEQSILFDCDNTLIDFPTGNYVLRGSTRFKFKNGGGITKSYTHVDNAAALWIAERVSISMDEGASFYWGESWIRSSRGGSALGFQPDEEGFVSLEIRGGVLEWHRTGNNGYLGDFGRKVGGNGKAKIKVDGTVFKPAYGTYSRQAIFEKFYEVELGEDGLEIINATNWNEYDIGAPLTGIGGVTVLDERKDKTDLFKLNLKKKNTARGPFSIGENVRVILENESNWMGTFPWSDQVEIKAFANATAFNMTFGGLNLSKPLVYRIWSETENDKINFVGEGIIPNGNEVQILLMNGYEPLPGTVFDLGSVPEDFDITSVINKNDKWDFQVVETDAGNRLVVSVKEIDGTKLVFNGGAEGSVVDLRETAGWVGGFIPSYQDVSIDGKILELNYEVPEFSSIALKNGAKVSVSMDNSLPLLKLSSGSELVVKEGVVLNLSAVPSVLFEESDSFSLPSIKVEKGAVLTLPGTSQFRGLKMDIQGTLQVLNKGDLIFGYANEGEIVPFGLSIKGGSVLVPEGNINFACPEKDGIVVAVDGASWIIDSAQLLQGTPYGFNFGVNNPESELIEVVLDKTNLDYHTAGYKNAISFSGAVRLVFNNGSRLYRGSAESFAEFHIKEKAQLVFNEGALFRIGLSKDGGTASGGTNLKLYPSWDAPSIVLNNGSTMDVYHDNGDAKGIVEINGSVRYEKTYSWWNTSDPLINYKAIELSRVDSVLNLTWASSYRETSVGDYHLRAGKFPRFDKSPMTGLGSVVIDSDHTASSKAYTFKTKNTTTGSLSVVPNKNVDLYLDNGFAWAGTVVANGFVYLGNRDANSASVVDIAKLDLQADFPVKVWKDEDGKITGNDVLNVGEYINNGGRLVPTLADEGDFVLGDKIVLGEIGDSSPLPHVAKGWTASRKMIDGKSMLVLSKGVGFLMIVR